jgi:ribosomal protein S6--L-glutamate ligase
MVFTKSLLHTRGMSLVTVGVLAEKRYLAHDQPAGLVRALRSAGVDVRSMTIEHTSIDLCDGSWCDGLDVVAARGRSDALLAALRSAEAAGVPVVNSSAAIHAVRDKAGMAAALAAAGIPTPTSWLGHPHHLAKRAEMRFPLVLKPMTGDNARGLRVVRTRSELGSGTWPEPVALAQEFHRGDGYDVKLYVAGDALWAVRRPSPVDDDGAARPATDPGRRLVATRRLREVGQACARLFGLSLCGVDCVLGPSGPLVVEVNDFPNYRGLHRSVDHDLARVVLAHRRATARRPLRVAPGE